MPPRRYARRKTYRKKKSYNKGIFNTNNFTPQSAYSLAVQAAKDIWYLKGLVNSEMLHNQSTGSTTTPNLRNILRIKIELPVRPEAVSF